MIDLERNALNYLIIGIVVLIVSFSISFYILKKWEKSTKHTSGKFCSKFEFLY